MTEQDPILLVASFGNPVAVDYARFVCERFIPGCGERQPVAVVANAALARLVAPPARFYPLASLQASGVRLTAPERDPGAIPNDALTPDSDTRVSDLVVFLPPRLTDETRSAIELLCAFTAKAGANLVVLITSANIHYDARGHAPAEDFARRCAQSYGHRTLIFRTDPVLSPRSPISGWLRICGACYPLAPGWLCGACVQGNELFLAIEELRRTPRTRRLYTVLGANQPWRERLLDHRPAGVVSRAVTLACQILSFCLLGQIGALALCALARFRPAWGMLLGATLKPRSLRELVALANPYNRRHIQVVGYNNGVRHFGHRYPGRTVVSTVDCNRIARTGSDSVRADCGVTVRKALDFLAKSSQEMYVVPNYSYVCLGTAFFVPIHGSAAAFSTIAETIVEGVFYDPAGDRVIRSRQNEQAFRDLLFNLDSDWLVLQIRMIVKPKSAYYSRMRELDAPAAEEILNALCDRQAANVEVRKAAAGDTRVKLFQYYNESSAGTSQAAEPLLELPRDRLGRLWDRLEENAITSFLMHALTRHFAWHVELFFTDQEFRTFWNTHDTQPLRKIQLRRIHRDGFPHSPFCDSDCVSADLFLLRRDRGPFEKYLEQTFTTVRSNPGKHSR